MTESSAQEIFLKALAALRPGIPATHGSLGVLPLTSTLPETADGPVPVAESLARGMVTIKEQTSPSVQSLRLTNRDEREVIVDVGDEMVGGKQNRVAARMMIVPPGEEVSLPVCCVEQMRWSDGFHDFVAGDLALLSVREVILASLAAGAARDGDPQGTVWAAVAAAQERAQVSSRAMPRRPTGDASCARARWRLVLVRSRPRSANRRDAFSPPRSVRAAASCADRRTASRFSSTAERSLEPRWCAMGASSWRRSSPVRTAGRE